MLHGLTPIFLKSSLISLNLHSLTPPYDKWQGYETPTCLVWISSLCWSVYIDKPCHLCLMPAQHCRLNILLRKPFSGSWSLSQQLSQYRLIWPRWDRSRVVSAGLYLITWLIDPSVFSFKSVVFGLHLVLVSCNFLAANSNPELESLRMDH